MEDRVSEVSSCTKLRLDKMCLHYSTYTHRESVSEAECANGFSVYIIEAE